MGRQPEEACPAGAWRGKKLPGAISGSFLLAAVGDYCWVSIRGATPGSGHRNKSSLCLENGLRRQVKEPALGEDLRTLPGLCWQHWVPVEDLMDPEAWRTCTWRLRLSVPTGKSSAAFMPWVRCLGMSLCIDWRAGLQLALA